ncbi:YtzI protein [Peribacillus kribbensis]|uniref:YtzI protein n=1 Tax=Peribacillus kribbensis TaxID=356658 RepID=UPI0004022661|nr:YtzI protein [Peribacillus kribbensis]
MKVILVVAVIIILAVLLLAVLTTSKAYTVKHTVDPLENNPNILKDENSTADDEPLQK